MVRNKKFRFPVTVLIGSDIGNLRKITRNKHIDPAYLNKYRATVAVSSILTVFSKLEKSFTGTRLENTKITEPPVFIIAFWRSGTTLLHNLLCQNPDFGYVSTFQTVFPNHTILNQWWLKLIAAPFFPKTRPADNMPLEWDNPQEEEMAVGNMQEYSFYNFMYFPKNLQDFIENGLMIDNLPPAELESWKKDYLRMIKIALLNTGGKQLISKNPPNAFRIQQLLKMFPDAKFINITRNQEEVIVSFKRFMKGVFRGTALQDVDDVTLENNIRLLYDLHKEKLIEGRKLIPEKNMLEIDYTDFIEHKIETIHHIYDTFGLQGYEQSLPMMQQYLDDTKDFKPWDHRKKKSREH